MRSDLANKVTETTYDFSASACRKVAAERIQQNLYPLPGLSLLISSEVSRKGEVKSGLVRFLVGACILLVFF
jgi:hypothetical protein